MAVTLEQFVKQLEDSGVIASGKLENFIPPKASPKDAEELARQLVLSRQLTKFQVQEIYQGRAKSLILGNYAIVDKIGAGGMGQVFKAEHRRMHRVVAIKILPTNVMKDSAAIARFQREVEAAARLSHRNIVAAYDANEAAGIHFLAMEFVEGADLSALVKKDGPLSVRTAVDYILQTAKGLEFAHGEGVVHRDIKPSNLLLDQKGTVKILDMGLARIESSAESGTQAELTGTGAVLGTIDYMAPEQAINTKMAGARADIYSLGCTLHYLLVGKPVFSGESVTAKLLAHHQQPIPNLCQLRPDVPEELQMVFSKMVAKKVEDRYQTMSEVVAALEPPRGRSFGEQTSARAQKSIDTIASAEALTFLNEIPTRTTLEPKTKKKPPTQSSVLEDGGGKTGKLISRKSILVATAAAVLAAATLAGALIALRNNDGGGKQSIAATLVPPAEKHAEASTKKLSPSETPAFNQWIKDVSALPAEQQVEAVVKKLQQLNPGFDGAQGHKIENGVVTELGFGVLKVTDISPVLALGGLKKLACRGNGFENERRGKLSDLSPLHGMHLTKFDCWSTSVSDLSPLNGMRLTELDFGDTPVADLSALKGMPLTILRCRGAEVVSDLSPLRGMPLTYMDLGATRVADLSSLKGMPLTYLDCGYTNVSDLSPLTGMALKEFYSTATPVSDLSPLKGMELSVLECGRGKVVDLSPLHGMPLARLDCSQTPVSDLSPLKGTALTSLECSNTSVANLTPLKGMRLTWLSCWSTPVPDLSPLKGIPLTYLDCDDTPVSDLSPLAGMPLTGLRCADTRVSDLSPLEGMALKNVFFSPLEIGKGLDVIRRMKTLETISLSGDRKDSFSPDDFWQRYDTQQFGSSKPIATFKDPGFMRWMQDVAALPAEKQVEAVVKKLHELNPGFNGEETHKIAGGVVTELQFHSDDVTDLSPVRALAGLTGLDCPGSERGSRMLSDLSPLEGMRLTHLACWQTRVTDLSPLKGMKLTSLACDKSKVADLSPLRGMPLTVLHCGRTWASDLSPLKRMPLTELWCETMPMSDLSPLEGMNLTTIYFTPGNIRKGLDVIRRMKSLAKIGLYAQIDTEFTPDEFWRKYDAGKFGGRP